MNLAAERGAKDFLPARYRSEGAMKLFTGSIVSAWLVLTAAANAQAPAPHSVGGSPTTVVSDVEGPYAAMPQGTPAQRYGPILLPPEEVYTVVRESGFSPLGIPQQRGLVYTISVIDRSGDDGRLVIDARTGRIIRFMPAYRMGDNLNADLTATYGAVGPLPPIAHVRGAPRPPRAIPNVASRMPAVVPMPKPTPPHGDETRQLPANPVAEPAQRSAGVRAKPADPQTTGQIATPATAEAKSAAPAIKPTEEMPKVQGLE
jgi:hypothetical protein